MDILFIGVFFSNRYYADNEIQRSEFAYLSSVKKLSTRDIRKIIKNIKQKKINRNKKYCPETAVKHSGSESCDSLPPGNFFACEAD